MHAHPPRGGREGRVPPRPHQTVRVDRTNAFSVSRGYKKRLPDFLSEAFLIRAFQRLQIDIGPLQVVGAFVAENLDGAIQLIVLDRFLDHRDRSAGEDLRENLAVRVSSDDDDR